MTRFLAACAAVLALTGVVAASAGAVGITGTITGGAALSLSSSATPSFGLTLNGTDQTASYVLPVTAVDPRGTGTGWNVTITSTQFKDATTHTFPTSASTITSVTNGCTTGSTCTVATNSITYAAFTIPAASTAPAAVKFFNSASATGLGSVDINANVSVLVPANTYAGTYTSTVTVSIVSGP